MTTIPEDDRGLQLQGTSEAEADLFDQRLCLLYQLRPLEFIRYRNGTL